MTGGEPIFDEHIIEGEEIWPRPDDITGIQMKLRLPWYRGLPLSCVERLDIDIDDETVPADDITLSLYGYHHRLDELAALHEVTWFTLDAADVRVRTDAPLPDGQHELVVTIQHRVPYVPGGGFKPVAKCTKTVTLTAEEDA